MNILPSTTSFILDSGERYCLVIDQLNGLPLYHPNLFITTQLRNKSDSFSTMVSAANNLVVFLRFLNDRRINLEERILSRVFLTVNEIDDLRDYTQLKALSLPRKIPKNKRSVDTLVSPITHYMRLTTISDYCRWYANYLIRQPNLNESKQIKRLESQIKSRRPAKKGRNNRQDKSLDDEQLEVLFELIRINSDFNPFSKDVQRRNRLIILLLYHLGLRGGELLNLRIQDIDFSKKILRVVRRADEKSDPRVFEPNAKTLERIIPLGDILVKELHDYITLDRRKIKNAKKNDFLFITHKLGPTVGQPITKSGYYKVINVVRSVSPDLYKLTGHKLRHTWNRKFSEKMDSLDNVPSEEKQEQMRSFLMGWKPGSKTAAIYNKRYIEEQAKAAAIKLQSDIGIGLSSRTLRDD